MPPSFEHDGGEHNGRPGGWVWACASRCSRLRTMCSSRSNTVMASMKAGWFLSIQLPVKVGSHLWRSARVRLLLR